MLNRLENRLWHTLRIREATFALRPGFGHNGTTGSRTLAANGVATAVKITSTSWQINGSGLT